MELFYLILIGLIIFSVLLLIWGLNFLKSKKKLCIGALLIVLGIIIILFVINNYLILIKENMG